MPGKGFPFQQPHDPGVPPHRQQAFVQEVVKLVRNWQASSQWESALQVQVKLKVVGEENPQTLVLPIYAVNDSELHLGNTDHGIRIPCMDSTTNVVTSLILLHCDESPTVLLRESCTAGSVERMAALRDALVSIGYMGPQLTQRGRGGTGIVFKCEATRIESDQRTTVAVKVFYGENARVNHMKEFNSHLQISYRTRNYHRYVVKIVNFSSFQLSDGQRVYFTVFEYLHTFAEVRHLLPKDPDQAALQLLHQGAHLLDELWQNGRFVLGDISKDNLMLGFDENNEVCIKFIDIGHTLQQLPVGLDEDVVTNDKAGKAPYSPPFKPNMCSHSSDTWALCASVVGLVLNRNPYGIANNDLAEVWRAYRHRRTPIFLRMSPTIAKLFSEWCTEANFVNKNLVAENLAAWCELQKKLNANLFKPVSHTSMINLVLPIASTSKSRTFQSLSHEKLRTWCIAFVCVSAFLLALLMLNCSNGLGYRDSSDLA